MSDTSNALEVLRAARGIIADEQWWGCDGELCDSQGRVCALGAVGRVLGIPDETMWSVETAHSAYNRIETHPAVIALGTAAAGGATDDPMQSVYRVNDQGHHAKVLALFDEAITALEAVIPEPTPAADAALEVMAACDQTGAVVAAYVVSRHPEADLAEVTALASAELFYAAQDVARMADHKAVQA